MDITVDDRLHQGEEDMKNIYLGNTQIFEPDQEVTDLHADVKFSSFRKIEKNCTDDTKENNEISETRLSDESSIFGLKKREKQQVRHVEVMYPGDHIIYRRHENDIRYYHHAIVTDLPICSEVKFKRDVEITEVEIAYQEEPRNRLSNNDEPCITMQNHKTCTETSQNYARSRVIGSEKMKTGKVEHDIKGRFKCGLKESIVQFLNKVNNFCMMTTTRSDGKLSLTLFLLLMLSTAHSKPIDNTKFSSVYAFSNKSILCQEIEKCLHVHPIVFRNKTCQVLRLSSRPHVKEICYAKQQICCSQTLYNSSHFFQKNFGSALHNPAMQMFLAFWRNIKHFLVGRTIERSSKKKQKNPFKIDDCYLLFSKLMKKETFINFSELKGASPYTISSTKKSSRHKKKSQDSHSHEHTSNFFRVTILCFLIVAAYLVIVEGYSLLLRTTVKIAVAVLVWMTFSAVKQYKEMEKVITWMEILGKKHIFFTETATANHLTYFERLGLLLRHFSCMIAGICVLAMYARKLNPLEVILVFSIVCIMMISTLWTVYLVNLPILKICKLLTTIGSALGIHSMATLNSMYLLIMYLVRKMFPIIAKLFCIMKNIKYKKMYIGIIKVIMIFIQCTKYLCLSLEEICGKVISGSEENVQSNRLESEKEEVKIGLSEEKICNLSEDEFERSSSKDSLFADDVLTKKRSDFEKEEYKKVKSFEEGHVDCVMSEESLLTIKDNTGESFLKVQEIEEVKDIHEQDENICKSKDMLDNANNNFETDELLLEKCKEKDFYTKDKIVYLSNTVQTENYRKPMETDIHEETSAKAVVNSSFSETDGMNNHNNDSNDLSDSSRLSINDFAEDQDFGVTENGYNIRLCTETSELEPMRSEISFCRSIEVDANVSPVGHCTCHADENSGREKVWGTHDGHVMPDTEMNEVYSCHKYSQCSDSTKSGKSYISSVCLGCNTNSSYEQDMKVYRCESGGSALTNSTDVCKNLKSVSVTDEKFSQYENSEEPMYSSQTVIDLQKKIETKAVKTKYSDGEEISKKLKKYSNDNDIANIVMNTLKEVAKKEVAKIYKKSKSHEKCLRKHKRRRISRRRLRRIVFSNRSNAPPSCKIQVTPVQNSPHLQAGLSDVSHENQNSNPNGANLSLQHVHQQNGAQNGLLNNIPSDMRPDAASATVSKSSFATSLPASSSSLSTYFSRLLMGYEFSVEEKMQYEMLRVQTFQDLPATCHASPLRLARTGFFSNGTNDEVVCFSCGVRYRNWQKRDDPMEIHRKISPECRMVNRRETRNIPIIPESNGFVSHNPNQESLPNLSNGFLQSTVLQDGGVSTQTSLSTQNRTLTRETIRNTNDADTTAQVRNQPQQPYAVQEAMRQPVEEQQTIRPPPSVDRAHSVLEGEQNRPAHRDMAEDLGITLERPKYPAYAQLSVRVSTFQGWPGYLDQAPRDMALAGFFYAGYNDYCRCFFCGGGLRNWDAGDDPWVEHARWFSKCPFVRQNRGHRFVEIIVKRQAEMQASGASGSAKNQTAVTTQSEIEARTQVTSQETSMTQTSIQSASANSNRDPAVESVRELGYSDEIIQRAVDIVKSHNPGKENIEARDILEVIFTITDDDTTTQTNTAVVSENTPSSAFGSSQASIQPSVRKTTSQAQTATSSVPASTSESSLPSLSVSSLETANAAVSGGKSGQASANKEITENEIRSLQEENTQLKEQVMCKICMDKNVSIAFLPCGHLACCIDCAPAMRKCPMCRVYIKGTVKTYLA